MIVDHPEDDYYSTAYRDYATQNPDSKLDLYVDEIVRHAPPSAHRLLDLGCGLGLFLKRMAERLPNWSIVGTDINDEAIEMSARLAPAATTFLHSASEPSHPPRSFDVVTAWDCIEHVHDLEGVGTAVRSMLEPGGLFAFVVPVYDGPLGPAVRLLDKDPTHVHKMGRDFWIEWAQARFDLLDWRGIFRYLVPVWGYVHIPSARLRRASNAILVLATNPSS